MNATTTRAEAIAHARACDEKIAAAWAAFHEVNDRAVALRKEAAKIERNLRYWSPSQRERHVARAAAKIEQAEAIELQAAPLREAARDLDAALYEGWQRFFLVEHIHASQHCSSFRPTTRVGWLPNVSGLTEAEAVAEHGATLCTICFPSAPVELTTPAADPDVCTGTRDREQPSRTGYHRGNWATCTCGARVTLTSTGKLRKHKPAA